MTTTQSSAPTVPSALATGHVGLNVTELDRSKAFYLAVLGLEVQAEGTEPERRWAFPGRFSSSTPGLHHLSFQVGSIEEVRAVQATLQGLSAEFAYDGVVPHGEGMASGGIYFSDPDGVRLEVYAPSGADTAPAPSGTAPTCGFF